VAAGSVRINAREKGGGSVWGLAAGGGLMAALGLGGAVIGRRRRASL
jgi:hypothetical protein